jgi:hypothetical protein
MSIEDNLKNIKVKLNKEEVYLIEFPIGDWSDDGHGKCRYYIASSKKPFQDIIETHARAHGVLGFDIGDICGASDEGTLTQNVGNMLRNLGYNFTESYIDGTDIYPSYKEMFNIWLFLLNHVNPSLELKDLNIPSMVPEVRNPGYGLFH